MFWFKGQKMLWTKVSEKIKLEWFYHLCDKTTPTATICSNSLYEQVLNILESYGNLDAAKGNLGMHRLIEALKHMFAIRMNLGDPDFENIGETVSEMLSPSFAQTIQHKILDNTTFPPEYYMDRYDQLFVVIWMKNFLFCFICCKVIKVPLFKQLNQVLWHKNLSYKSSCMSCFYYKE